MRNFKERIATIQDISCLGQCSLTVALPIISALGIETAVIPTAVLSTHTGGFSGYTFLDLTDEIPKIANHWAEQKVQFDAIYTGYVGSKEQIAHIENFFDLFGKDSKIIVDPVMADKGILYKGFPQEFPSYMAKLCAKADVILPNLTEACFLLNQPYVESGYDKEYIEKLLTSLSAICKGNVILTGVSFEPSKLGVAVYNADKKAVHYYFSTKIDVSMHGTGDVYASSFSGCYAKGFSLEESADIAVDYTVECIKQTLPYKDHWYGVKFEKALPFLLKRAGII